MEIIVQDCQNAFDEKRQAEIFTITYQERFKEITNLFVEGDIAEIKRRLKEYQENNDMTLSEQLHARDLYAMCLLIEKE